MMQAGDGDRMKGFIAGQFHVKAGQITHQVDLCVSPLNYSNTNTCVYVAPLKDSMLLGMDFLRDHKAKLNLDAGTLCFGGRDYVHDLWPEPGSPGGSSDSDNHSVGGISCLVPCSFRCGADRLFGRT